MVTAQGILPIGNPRGLPSPRPHFFADNGKPDQDK